MFQVVLEERGGAPLHFLLAWTVAHLGLGLEGLRALSALFAVASLPVIALLLARLGRSGAGADRDPPGGDELDLPLPRRLRPHVQPLPPHAALSYLALLGALDRGGRRAWALWALAILATVATHPYGALVLAPRGVRRRWLVASACARRSGPSPSSPCSGSRSGSPTSCSPAASTSASARGAKLGGLRRRVRLAGGRGLHGRLRRCSRPCSWPRLPALAVLPRATRAPAPLRRRASRVAASRRPHRQHGVAGDAPPDLPAPVLRAGGRRRDRAARPPVGHALRLAALVVAQLAWAWTAPGAVRMGAGRPRRARADAAAYVAATAGPTTCCFGYDPLFLQALGAEPGRSRSSSCRARTPTSPCTACSRSSGRSDAASGYWTRARHEHRPLAADPAACHRDPSRRSRCGATARSSSSARGSRW